MNHCLLINKSRKKGSVDLKKFYSLELVDLYSSLNLYCLEIDVRKMSTGKEMGISYNKPPYNRSL